MYFPYLRGRQYELLTLRELVSKGQLSEKIRPIIEPVKLSSTFLSTLKSFKEHEKEIFVICNSPIFSIVEHQNKKEEYLEFLELLSNKFIVKAFLLEKNLLASLEKMKIQNYNEIMIICKNIDTLDEYKTIFKEHKPAYTLISGDSRYRRKLGQSENLVLLEDRFIDKVRNSDYSLEEDEFFSDDHLFYKQEGYVGFSDYSVLGEKFREGGFAPYAVAIHLLYFDEDKSLRIHHFVSDSNFDVKDPAGKFYEAVQKLCSFHQIQLTSSLKIFQDYFTSGGYPGLGSVKKLSLAHHLELIDNFFKESDKL